MMNMRVKRSGNTIFMALPADLHRPIVGGCECPYCKANPEDTPMWDTLAVGIKVGKDLGGSEYTWTVHYPDL